MDPEPETVEPIVKEIVQDLDSLQSDGEELKAQLAHWESAARQVQSQVSRARQVVAEVQQIQSTMSKPAPAASPMEPEPVCPSCSKPVRVGAKFCRFCGGAISIAPPLPPPAVAAPAPAPPPAVPVFAPPPPPSVGEIIARTATIPPPPQPGAYVPPSASGPAFVPPSPAGPVTGKTYDLPVGTGPWPIQDKLSDIGQKAVDALKQSGLKSDNEWTRIAIRLVRAALLDKTIYREVCADPAAEREAKMAMGAIIVLIVAVPMLIFGGGFSQNQLVRAGANVTIQVIAWYGRAWIIQMFMSAWLKTKPPFGQVFRPLVYAQGPVLLALVPGTGTIVQLWSLVTNTAAIRDATGCNTVQAIVLSLAAVAGISFGLPIVSDTIYKLLQVVGL